jgi:hypothetical protein
MTGSDSRFAVATLTSVICVVNSGSLRAGGFMSFVTKPGCGSSTFMTRRYAHLPGSLETYQYLMLFPHFSRFDASKF